MGTEGGQVPGVQGIRRGGHASGLSRGVGRDGGARQPTAHVFQQGSSGGREQAQAVGFQAGEHHAEGLSSTKGVAEEAVQHQVLQGRGYH